MLKTCISLRGIIAAGLLGCGIFLVPLHAQQAGTVAIDADDISGVVTSAKGPEAGVWVIAETKSLPTGYRKIVVTDDRGRFVVPDLPQGTYTLFVRGYGLVDSKPVPAKIGTNVRLTAVVAPSPRAAAQYYPANYWFSLMEIPPKSAFPMEKEGIKDQVQWIATMKSAIQLYQVGDKATREIPEKLGKFKSTAEAIEAWIKTMESPIAFSAGRLPKETLIKLYASWLDRIAAGELPPAPARPRGVERNVVITQWDVSNEKAFIHDVMTTDTRNPTLNPNGLVYGPEQHSADVIVALDPVKNSWTRFPVPIRDKDMPPAFGDLKNAFLTWGDEAPRPSQMRLHNMMMDENGRFWITGKFRKGDIQPAYCKAGSDNPSAKWYPLARNGDLEVLLYDPKTKQFKMVDTCFQTHHLIFANDANRTLWAGGGGGVLGFLNTKLYEETGDESKAQGWCPYILDTNGNGKPDPGWVEPKDPVAPGKDKRIQGGGYGIATNPVDGSVWTGIDQSPGFILRVQPGPNPPMTCLTEIYSPPPGASNPKGVFVDYSTGVVWTGFSGTDQFASFDRRKCKVLNGPTATGNHCPEGWTLYPQPGPKFKGVTDPIGTDWYYLNWVDNFDTLGLGKNVPMAPGTNSDSIVALMPQTKQWVVIRNPYPLGFFARGMDGRIDDPKAGWKGRGLWSNYASISPWNMEGGKGSVPKYVKFQVRPDPLAH